MGLHAPRRVASRWAKGGSVLCLGVTLSVVAFTDSFTGGERAALARPASEEAVAQRINAYLAAIATDDRFSGTVLVARGGKVLFAKGYGLADVGRGLPDTATTQFRIGSVTKTFTALALLQLVERKRLRLDDPICDYVPRCPAPWRPITIRMLLAHTAGLSDALDSADWRVLKGRPLPRVVDRLRSLQLQFAPGTRWSYCNACYLVAGYVLERATQTNWLGYLRRHIFEPAGMTSTTYDVERPRGRRALAYIPDRFGVLRPAPRLAMANPDTAGGLKSTVLDLYRFEQALESHRILSARLERLMFTGTRQSRGSWGLGWELGGRRGHRVQRHTGSVGGWAAVLSRYPDDKLTVIVLSNLSADAVTQINHVLPSIVFGWPYRAPRLAEPVPLDPGVLAREVGRYRVNRGQALVLQVNRAATGKALVLYPGPYGGGDRLIPLSARRFLDARAPHWSVEFRFSGDRVTEMVVNSTRPRTSFTARRLP